MAGDKELLSITVAVKGILHERISRRGTDFSKWGSMWGIEHLNNLGIREEHWEWGVYFGYVNASSDLMSFMYFRACLNKLSTRPKTGV